MGILDAGGLSDSVGVGHGAGGVLGFYAWVMLVGGW